MTIYDNSVWDSINKWYSIRLFCTGICVQFFGTWHTYAEKPVSVGGWSTAESDCFTISGSQFSQIRHNGFFGYVKEWRKQHTEFIGHNYFRKKGLNLTIGQVDRVAIEYSRKYFWTFFVIQHWRLIASCFLFYSVHRKCVNISVITNEDKFFRLRTENARRYAITFIDESINVMHNFRGFS